MLMSAVKFPLFEIMSDQNDHLQIKLCNRQGRTTGTIFATHNFFLFRLTNGYSVFSTSTQIAISIKMLRWRQKLHVFCYSLALVKLFRLNFY